MIGPRMLAAATLFAAMAPAWAQQAAPGPAMPMKHGTSMSGMATPTAATKAFKAADEKMMRDMDRPMTGDADQDFVAGMLPHHAGAVDMASAEIHYGKDPVLRRLARGIVAAQEKEIALMRAWQAKHPITSCRPAANRAPGSRCPTAVDPLASP